ncbi:FSR family fosmidomycin resistance protein-like MFS transporter [Povalibacter uvarum]|uniref:FSR family fosmidomycin resistance protein-like MFS transporter n=1 Tax=Povalibacter uvarum TaxID=732238 RepID=A0A841HR23_9GAMM|nr:MFS transporter [Povalibacter uvarum]MBB6095336.1 FSR family fosmidomycin resistance protein-like MFS transporter [Povalibacter uvarum]
MNTAAETHYRPEATAIAVLGALSFCHFLNDMMQSLLPAMYPMLKTGLALDFGQIGLITLVYQLTASLFQPLVGLYTDKRPLPYALACGMGFTLVGLLLLSKAASFPMLLVAAAVIGIGSSIFHPESSRLARLASGGRHGFAQSFFQVGGNAGTAVGPLAAAFIVLPNGQRSVAWFALAAMIGIVLLAKVGSWYARHNERQATRKQPVATTPPFSRGKVFTALAILVALIFSKYFYLASFSSYYTFYLIHKFNVSVWTAQVHLFVFLAAVAAGTLLGGPIGDRIGRKYVIWFSILGVLPFTLILPHVNLFWTGVLSVPIGLILASAFAAILVYAQELVPGKVGMISGLFFGIAFGMGGLGAAVLGHLADVTSIEYVYGLCAYLPIIGILAAFLPNPKRA